MFATTPIIIRSIEGGTSCDVPPAAAIIAVANGVGYRFFFIAGIVTDPIAAVSALAEPQTPEKYIVETIDTIPSPPRNLPTKTIARSIILCAIPPWPIIVPAKINRGIASRVNESIPDIYFCGRKIKKSGDITKIAANEANPRDIAIGTERTSKTAKTRIKTIPGSKLFLICFIFF